MEETLTAVLSLVLGLLMRFGLPLALTVALVWLLRWLDDRWQAEAQVAGAVTGARNTGCWKVHDCPEESREKCRAYAYPEIPCWQHFRSREGRLQERCLDCKVFREAPIPVPLAGD